MNNKFLNLIAHLNFNQIRLLTAFISLCFSMLAFHVDGLMNSDGVLYMNMAKAYLEGGLGATAQLYDWPFFSILIATVHQLLGLSLEHAGQIINITFFVIFTDAIFLMTSKLLENQTQLFIAAIFILSFIIINDYRAYIIRDIGYWAMIMLSVYRLSVFRTHPSWQNATFWQLAVMAALLFRVEASVILLALPLILLLDRPLSSGLKNLFKSYYLIAGIGALLIIFLLQHEGIASAFSKLQSLLLYADLTKPLTTFQQKADIIANSVLNQYSEDYSGLILFSGLLVMMLQKVLIGISPGYLGLFAYGYFSQKTPVSRLKNNSDKRLVVYFTLLNIIILLVFLYNAYFLSSRYMVMLFVSLLILMLPALSAMTEKALIENKKWLVFITGMLLLAGVVDAFTASVTKKYIKQTAIWASQELPPQTRVLTDDIFIDFYFNENEPQAELELSETLGNYHSYDYLIVVQKLKHHREQQLNQLEITPLQAFSNERGDKAVVYRIGKK